MSELVEKAKADLMKGKNRLLNTFQAVPDDKLSWSPGGQSRTPLQIVAHCGFSNFGLSEWIAGNVRPRPSDHETAEREKSIQTRDAAVKLIEESAEKVLTVLDAITEANYDDERPSPFGNPFKIRDLMFIPALHFFTHASQIDYMQTIWGDMEWHM